MNVLSALRNAMQVPELRRKLLITVGLICADRLLASITIPAVNTAALRDLFQSNGLLGLLNLFSGSGFSTGGGGFGFSGISIVALGLNPYINATIIMQLMTVISTRVKELSKEGEQGRKRLTQYARYLTVVLALLQSFGFVRLFQSYTFQGQSILSPTLSWPQVVGIIITLTAGTVIIMWFGELITEYGIGNGVSIIIMIGILGQVPGTVLGLGHNSSQIFTLFMFAVIGILVSAGIIFVQQATRKIPIQSAQRVMGRNVYQGRSSFLPLRVNQAGVIPIIFAVSIMFFPTLFGNFFSPAAGQSGGVLGAIAVWIHNNWNPFGPTLSVDILYEVAYFGLVMAFTFFYTAVTFDPEDTADNLRKNAVFIPGIRPGAQTADYLSRVMGRITLAGAIFLGVITVVLPVVTALATGQQPSTGLYLGGTAVLIVVGVSLDTMKQLETQLLMRQYRGFIR
ncbi:MAG TPA: preprotein translocase subunit SecY [Verrucomicrobiae bacterium]|nr:preprotein translocase subunit SecY [Verrucomicrobiae bacterium]